MQATKTENRSLYTASALPLVSRLEARSFFTKQSGRKGGNQRVSICFIVYTAES
jgi:hypothetical protein